MHYLVLATILAIGLARYLTGADLLPGPMAFLPEMLSAVIVLYVVIVGGVQRFQYVRTQYWLIFGALAVTIVCGIIANAVEPGPIVAGIRYYLRAIPLFLLPAVYNFKESQIRQQLALVAGLGLLQVPIAIAQRVGIEQAGRWSGDGVTGTLLISSVLSLFLICCVCVLTGLFLRKRIGKLAFIALFLLLLVPTTINETKGTVLLLPIGLLLTVLIGSPPAKRLRMAAFAVAILAVFGTGFVVAYNYTVQDSPYAPPIGEFFSDEEAIGRYLQKDTDVGARQEAGRIDSLVVPLRYLSRDPVQLTFGLGIGNASHSSLGEQFTGHYFPIFGQFLVTSASVFLLEIGLFGTLLLLLLYWAIFRDSLVVARKDEGIRGALAIGWAGATAVMTIATFYKTTFVFESLSYLFWYFSGMVAARRMQLLLERSRTKATPVRPPGLAAAVNSAK